MDSGISAYLETPLTPSEVHPLFLIKSRLVPNGVSKKRKEKFQKSSKRSK